MKTLVIFDRFVLYYSLHTLLLVRAGAAGAACFFHTYCIPWKWSESSRKVKQPPPPIRHLAYIYKVGWDNSNNGEWFWPCN